MRQFLSAFFLDDGLRVPRFVCAVALFAIIVVLGSIPGARSEVGNLASGVVLHSVAYSIITILLYTGTDGTRRYRLVRTVLTVAAMGAVDEMVQTLLPYRRGAVLDWLIDCTASLATGSMLYWFLPQRSATGQG